MAAENLRLQCRCTLRSVLPPPSGPTGLLPAVVSAFSHSCLSAFQNSKTKAIAPRTLLKAMLESINHVRPQLSPDVLSDCPSETSAPHVAYMCCWILASGDPYEGRAPVGFARFYFISLEGHPGRFLIFWSNSPYPILHSTYQEACLYGVKAYSYFSQPHWCSRGGPNGAESAVLKPPRAIHAVRCSRKL